MSEERLSNVIDGATVLSHLEPGTIWALFSIGLFAFVVWDRRDRMRKESQWMMIREKQLAEDAGQTEVLKRVVDEIASIKLMVTKYLIEKE